MPRKGENIYKRKDGRWEGRYIKARSQTGKAVYGYVYAPTYKEAKRKRSQAVLNIEANPTVPRKAPENTIPPCFIRKLADDWMNSIQSQIKKSSYVKYYNILHSYILPEFDNVPLSELTSSRIQKFCDDLLTHGSSSGEGLSPKTVLDILSLMRSLLRYAQIHGHQPPSTGKEIIIRQTAPDTVVIPRSSQEVLCRYLYEKPMQVALYWSPEAKKMVDELAEKEHPKYVIGDMVRSTEYIRDIDSFRIADLDDRISLRYKRQLDNDIDGINPYGAFLYTVPKVLRAIMLRMRCVL